jgi:hypothetical protein
MAPSPFRRRKAAKTVRNLAIAEAALALAKDRVGHGSRRSRGTLLAIGGAVAAVGVAALLKRDKVAGLLPSRSGEPEPPAPAPPQPSNYDAPGPVANTATPIPAPDPQGERPAVDESAEEAAAAAEAAAIGGTASDYAGQELGEIAGEAERPLAEAGQGEAEGQEQAEAALADNATYRDAGADDAERRIGDAIAEAGQPQSGETPEPLAAPGGGISGRPYSGLDEEGETPGEEPSSADATATDDAAGDSSSADATKTDDAAGGGDSSSADAAKTDDAGAGREPSSADDTTTGGDEPSSPDATAADDATAANERSSPDAPDASDDSPAATGEESGGDEWRTWSGRSVNP